MFRVRTPSEVAANIIVCRYIDWFSGTLTDICSRCKNYRVKFFIVQGTLYLFFFQCFLFFSLFGVKVILTRRISVEFILFTRECNETSIAGSQKALTHSLTHSLDFVNYFIYGNYNVPYYNAADQCIRLSPW